mmetsp:Transcript_120247/g.208751  ORF Transcript_120247/g.208751 Transcript_120247/m.208751 type:complete len:322 (+) Transcript_120247:78-1043(+)
MSGIEFTPEKLDEKIKKMDKTLAFLKDIKRQTDLELQRREEEGVENEGCMSPFTVKRKKTVIEIMEPLGEAAEFMNNILKDETGTERPKLHEIFGRDNQCQRVEHIKELADVAQHLVAKSHFASDERWQGTQKACESIECVLREAGLGAELNAARAKAVQEVADIVPRGVRRASVVPDAPLPPVLVRSMTSDRKALFAELDLAESEVEVLDSTRRIFESYGKAQDEVLEGTDFENVTQVLVEHVQKEAAEKAAERGLQKALLPSNEVVRKWVLSVIDPNLDGAITFKEGLVGFKAVVDDIETQDEVNPRSRAATAAEPTES